MVMMISNKVKSLNIRFRLLKSGFTLAEILVVLGIIGIIAALVIPNMMKNVQYHQLVEATKKEYSTLESALLAYRAENGVSDYVGLFTPGNTSTQSLNNFSKYLKIAKNCGGTNTGCFDWKFNLDHNGTVRDFNRSEYAKAVLSDGTALVVQQLDGDGNGNCVGSCANVWFDVNGSKPPNTDGQDMFGFAIFPNRIGYAWGGDSLKSVLIEGKLIIYNEDGTYTINKKVP